MLDCTWPGWPGTNRAWREGGDLDESSRRGGPSSGAYGSVRTACQAGGCKDPEAARGSYGNRRDREGREDQRGLAQAPRF